jgi:hypothetical protein
MEANHLKVFQAECERGDFYVASDCCLFCGVPQAAAPDLIGWTDDKYALCYWKKQPETSEELEQAIAVLSGQDVGCHRYAGRDPAVQLRIGGGNCDFRDAWQTSDGSSMEQDEVEPPRFWSELTIWERFWARFKKF